MSEKKEISEEAIPVQEIKKTTTISVQRFIRSLVVVILSFICVFIGVLIDQLHTPLDDFHPTFTREQKSQMSFPDEVKVLNVKSVNPVEEVKPEIIPAETETVESIGVDYPLQEMKSEVQEVKTEDVNPSVDENKIEQEIPKTIPMNEPKEKSELKMRDILQLRDNLQNGKSCFHDLQKLLKITLSETEKKLLDNIMPVCLTNGQSFSNLNKVFYANKKKALMTYYKENNPRWLAYTKMVASMIVEVRRINPKKQTPKNILFMAENALDVRDFEKVIQTVRKLPKTMQLDFIPFVQLATEYVNAQNATEQLILSFERKGE